MSGIRALVHAVITEIMPSLEDLGVDEGRSLKELGADSVDRVEIIVSVLHRLGLGVPISTFNDTPDLRTMIAILEQLVLEKK